jgi:transposase
MLEKDLFQLALNVQDPWFIDRIEFIPEEKRLDIWIDFFTGSEFVCPVCGISGCKAYDTSEKTWRHLDFFQHKCYLHCRVPRVECEDCGIHQAKVPWSRKGSGFTLLMDGLIILMAQKMPVSHIADLLKEHDTRIWRVIEHYVDEARKEEDFSNISSVGIDETSCKKGHHYISVVADLNTSKVIFLTKGKDSSVVDRFKSDFSEHHGVPANIDKTCCDMSPAFINGIEEHFPNAEITFDKFHIMKIVNEALDQVRRNEQSGNALLKKTRYIWLKNPFRLTQKQLKRLGNLKQMNLKTVRAYNIKLSLQTFWAIEGREAAEKYLKKWYFWVTHSRLGPMIEAAKTIKRHWKGVMNFIESKVTNGVLEGLNSSIQALKRSARGYRNTKNFMTMVYLRLGQLRFNIPT